jgi:hypothetical protein
VAETTGTVIILVKVLTLALVVIDGVTPEEEEEVAEDFPIVEVEVEVVVVSVVSVL